MALSKTMIFLRLPRKIPIRFASRRNRGGATFTLLIFVLLLVSSGLMYYYFHRCQVLESELAKWKSGIKEREPAPESVTASATPARKESLRDLAANLGARLAGTPAAEPVKAETPAPPPTRASAKPTPEQPAATPQAGNSTSVPDSELPAPEPAPTPAHANAQQTPKPGATKTPGPKPTGTPHARTTPISSMYDLQKSDSQPDQSDEPAVRVRAPKRTGTPSARLNLNERQ